MSLEYRCMQTQRRQYAHQCSPETATDAHDAQMPLAMLFNGYQSEGREGGGLGGPGGPCGLWRCKLGAEHFVPKTTRDSKAVFIVRIVMLEVVLLELFIVGWKAVIAVSITSRTQGSMLLAFCDGGSNGLSHSRCSQKCLHRIQLLLRTNRRKTLCGRACKKVLQGRRKGWVA